MADAATTGTRRAILSRPERPFGVAIVTGLLYLLGFFLVVSGIVLVVTMSQFAQDDAALPPEERMTTTTDVALAAGAAAVMLVAALLLAWVGAANAAGRPWAWSVVAVGAVVVSCFCVIGVFGTLSTAVTLRSGQQESFAIVATGYGIGAVVVLVVPYYYRRDEVRSFFGRRRARQESDDAPQRF